MDVLMGFMVGASMGLAFGGAIAVSVLVGIIF